MCISPSYVYTQAGPTYEKVPVPCRVCWRCKSNRVNSYVGRCLAEAAVSDWSMMITLTYAPPDGRPWFNPGTAPIDHAEKHIHINHFQDFVRSLRDSHHRIRYFVAAERGDFKGRVHFHALLFGKGKAPEIAMNQRAWHRSWPHGHVYAEPLNDKTARYAAKYLETDNIEGWFSLSKKPPLGFEWFLQKAEMCIRLGTMPSSFLYLPPGGHPDRPYLLTGATKAWFVTAVWAGMKQRHKSNLGAVNRWVRDAVIKEDTKRFKRLCEAMPIQKQFKAMLERLDAERPSMLSVQRALNRAFMQRPYLELDERLPNGKTVAENIKDSCAVKPSADAQASPGSVREVSEGGESQLNAGYKTRAELPYSRPSKSGPQRGSLYRLHSDAKPPRFDGSEEDSED